MASRSQKHLKVILNATPEYAEKLTLKAASQRRQRDNFCISVWREDSRCIEVRMMKSDPYKQLLVKHVTEGH